MSGFVVCSALVGCSNKGDLLPTSNESSRKEVTARIQNKGSDTMVVFAQQWALEYKKVDPRVDVEVGGGGSGVGIAALMNGTVDLANSSREMKPLEMEQARRKSGKDAKAFVVGYDALAIFVYRDNPLNEISIEQLAEIYAEGGSITHWSQLGVKVPGCESDEILCAGRGVSSGTFEFLLEHVLKNRNYKPAYREMNTSRELVDLVTATPCVIGYSGMGYGTPQVKMLKISNKPGARAFLPSLENTLNRTYPLSRSLQVYTLGEPEGTLKQYVDWIRSEAGQKILEDSGYVPIAPHRGKK
jgi:phosphate transport system substrate-binding protein